MGFPPFWGLRSPVLPDRAMVDFALFGAGASTWMGSRDVRRRTTDLLTVTAVPRWGRQLVTWAATTGWAMAAYLACVVVLYWSTARQGAWGGPPLWPVAVGAAGVAAACALGFAAGLPVAQLASMGSVYKLPVLGSPVYAAATRFAALPAAARHAWLLAHLAALRAGQITLGQLP